MPSCLDGKQRRTQTRNQEAQEAGSKAASATPRHRTSRHGLYQAPHDQLASRKQVRVEELREGNPRCARSLVSSFCFLPSRSSPLIPKALLMLPTSGVVPINGSSLMNSSQVGLPSRSVAERRNSSTISGQLRTLHKNTRVHPSFFLFAVHSSLPPAHWPPAPCRRILTKQILRRLV